MCVVTSTPGETPRKIRTQVTETKQEGAKGVLLDSSVHRMPKVAPHQKCGAHRKSQGKSRTRVDKCSTYPVLSSSVQRAPSIAPVPYFHTFATEDRILPTSSLVYSTSLGVAHRLQHPDVPRSLTRPLEHSTCPRKSDSDITKIHGKPCSQCSLHVNRGVLPSISSPWPGRGRLQHLDTAVCRSRVHNRRRSSVRRILSIPQVPNLLNVHNCCCGFVHSVSIAQGSEEQRPAAVQWRWSGFFVRTARDPTDQCRSSDLHT